MSLDLFFLRAWEGEEAEFEVGDNSGSLRLILLLINREANIYSTLYCTSGAVEGYLRAKTVSGYGEGRMRRG